MGERLSEQPLGRRRPTIKDVAARAGVHPATASRALNPALPGRISAATTRRVEEAARQLGYQPDPTARSLRTRRSGFVGVVVPDLTNPVLPPMIRAIEEVLWEAGLACLLTDTDNRLDREAALIDELLARRCEGLLVATATRHSDAVGALANREMPTVLLTREPDSTTLPIVRGDDAGGVRSSVEHLVGLGHENIAYLAGPPNLSTTVRREEAFRQAMAELIGIDGPVVERGAGFTVAAGCEAAATVLDRHRDITALLAGNDMMALGAYRALAARDMTCPREISVVGHNDMPFMDQVQPPLTTVAVPQPEVGTEGARMLLDLRDGREVGTRSLVLPTKLVIRGSTAAPR